MIDRKSSRSRLVAVCGSRLAAVSQPRVSRLNFSKKRKRNKKIGAKLGGAVGTRYQLDAQPVAKDVY